VCFETRGVVLCNSRDVEIVQNAGGVFNCWRCVQYWRIRESRCRREEGIYILEFLRVGSYPAFCWLMNTKRPILHLAQPPGTSWMRSLEMRFSTRGEDSLRRWALLWHHIPLLPLRPSASRSTLSSSEVVPCVQPSNTATNAKQWKKHTQLMSYDGKYVIVCFAMLLALPKGISNRKLKIYTIDGSKYCAKNECNTMILAPRWHKHHWSGANGPSEVAVTVNIYAQLNLSSIWSQLTP